MSTTNGINHISGYITVSRICSKLYASHLQSVSIFSILDCSCSFLFIISNLVFSIEPNQYFVVSFNVKTNFSVKTNDSKLRGQPPLHHPKEKDPDFNASKGLISGRVLLKVP